MRVTSGAAMAQTKQLIAGDRLLDVMVERSGSLRIALVVDTRAANCAIQNLDG